MSEQKIYVMMERSYITPIWHARSLEGLRRAAARQKRAVCQINSFEDLDPQQMPTAMVLVSTGAEWTTATIAQCRRQNIRPILIGSMPGKFGENVSGTMYGNSAAIEALVNYFVQNGRRKLAMAGLYTTSSNDMAKRDAFLSIANQLGLPVGQEDVYLGTEAGTLPDKQFFENIRNYQGVLCANDFIAANVLCYAKAHGIKVPEELFVAGLGDTILCRYTQPTLTSATRAYEETGEQAFYIWKQLCTNPRLSSIVITVACELRPRGSTANAALPTTSLTGSYTGEIPNLVDLSDEAEDRARALVSCLHQCSKLDMQIIQGLVSGKSMEKIAEEQAISVSTGRYRMKKLYALANVSTKTEFVQLFRRYIHSDRIFDDFEDGNWNQED